MDTLLLYIIGSDDALTCLLRHISTYFSILTYLAEVQVTVWLPLLSTALGGLIAAFAGYWTATVQNEAALKKASIDRTLQKAEELYDLILRTEHVFCSWHNAIRDDQFEQVNSVVNEHEQRRISLLTDIYLPELRDAANKVMEKRTQFGGRFAYYLTEYAGKKVKDPAAIELKRQCIEQYGELESAMDNLRQSIAAAIDRYID